MKGVHELRSKIVRFLGTNRLELLDASEQDWTRNLRWLDRSGVALLLAARLEVLPPETGVPSGIRRALHTRLADNYRRMERMLEFFQGAVQALDAADVRYFCVKGFSLIPDCFDGIRERHQIDLDFVIASKDITRAKEAIEMLGYHVQSASDSGEVRLIKPWKNHIGVNGYLYQLPEPPPIELHTQVWEPDTEEIEFSSLAGFADHTEVHELAGIEFPRLSPDYQLVYLLLHIFRHLLGSWARLLSLYEVATLLRVWSNEESVWAEAATIIQRDPRLVSACALILGLVERTFPVELPQPLSDLCVRNLSSDSAFWIENCSTAWLYADPPGNKLALLVQRQFWQDGGAWRRYLLRRLVPFRKPHRLSDEAVESTKRSMSYRVEDAWYQASRAWYHVRSDYEYLVARRRWAEAGKTNARSSHSIVDEC